MQLYTPPKGYMQRAKEVGNGGLKWNCKASGFSFSWKKLINCLGERVRSAFLKKQNKTRLIQKRMTELHKIQEQGQNICVSRSLSAKIFKMSVRYPHVECLRVTKDDQSWNAVQMTPVFFNLRIT